MAKKKFKSSLSDYLIANVSDVNSDLYARMNKAIHGINFPRHVILIISCLLALYGLGMCVADYGWVMYKRFLTAFTDDYNGEFFIRYPSALYHSYILRTFLHGAMFVLGYVGSCLFSDDFKLTGRHIKCIKKYFTAEMYENLKLDGSKKILTGNYLFSVMNDLTDARKQDQESDFKKLRMLGRERKRTALEKQQKLLD